MDAVEMEGHLAVRQLPQWLAVIRADVGDYHDIVPPRQGRNVAGLLDLAETLTEFHLLGVGDVLVAQDNDVMLQEGVIEGPGVLRRELARVESGDERADGGARRRDGDGHFPLLVDRSSRRPG